MTIWHTAEKIIPMTTFLLLTHQKLWLSKLYLYNPLCRQGLSLTLKIGFPLILSHYANDKRGEII